MGWKNSTTLHYLKVSVRFWRATKLFPNNFSFFDNADISIKNIRNPFFLNNINNFLWNLLERKYGSSKLIHLLEEVKLLLFPLALLLAEVELEAALRALPRAPAEEVEAWAGAYHALAYRTPDSHTTHHSTSWDFSWFLQKSNRLKGNVGKGKKQEIKLQKQITNT